MRGIPVTDEDGNRIGESKVQIIFNEFLWLLLTLDTCCGLHFSLV